jgi:membrane associated rhomboid family serine protease
VLYLKLLRSSPGTAAILAIQLAIYLSHFVLPRRDQEAFLLVGLDVLQGRFTGAFVSMMAHQWWLHWLCNAYGTFVLGILYERFVGTGGFLFTWFVSGLFGNVLSLLCMPIGEASLGSSGAVFGLVGALLAEETKLHRRLVDMWRSPLSRQLVIVAALNLAFGLWFSQHINNWAHVGGLVSGFVVSLLFVPANRPPDDRLAPWLRAGVALLLVMLAVWSAVPAYRPLAANGLAYDLALRGAHVDRAARLAEEAYRLSPDEFVEGTLAVCYVRQGRAREAVPLLEDAIRRHRADDEKNRAVDTLWLALAKAKAGDHAGARQAYNRAMASRDRLEKTDLWEFETVRRKVKAEMHPAK